VRSSVSDIVRGEKATERSASEHLSKPLAQKSDVSRRERARRKAAASLGFLATEISVSELLSEQPPLARSCSGVSRGDPERASGLRPKKANSVTCHSLVAGAVNRQKTVVRARAIRPPSIMHGLMTVHVCSPNNITRISDWSLVGSTRFPSGDRRQRRASVAAAQASCYQVSPPRCALVAAITFDRPPPSIMHGLTIVHVCSPNISRILIGQPGGGSSPTDHWRMVLPSPRAQGSRYRMRPLRCAAVAAITFDRPSRSTVLAKRAMCAAKLASRSLSGPTGLTLPRRKSRFR
jgi:hypothetical protein